MAFQLESYGVAKGKQYGNSIDIIEVAKDDRSPFIQRDAHAVCSFHQTRGCDPQGICNACSTDLMQGTRNIRFSETHNFQVVPVGTIFKVIDFLQRILLGWSILLVSSMRTLDLILQV